MTTPELYAYRVEIQSCIRFYKDRDHELCHIFKDENERVSKLLSELFGVEFGRLAREIKKRHE